MKHAFTALGLMLLLIGCTNSPTVLKILYGQFDNFMANEILDYADFTDQQEERVREAVDQTVEWHRSEALPEYVGLLSEAQARLLDQQPTSADIDWLFGRTLKLGQDFERKSPLLAIRSTIAELSDQQIMQIKGKINEEFADEEKEMQKNADKNPAELSTENLSKFFKRIGLKLNRLQKQNAKSYFSQRRISEQDRMPVWRAWADQLIEILESRQQESFPTQFENHYKSRLTLIQRTFTADWEHDQALSKAMLLDLFQNLNDSQKQAMRERWASLSSVATDLATR